MSVSSPASHRPSQRDADPQEGAAQHHARGQQGDHQRAGHALAQLEKVVRRHLITEISGWVASRVWVKT